MTNEQKYKVFGIGLSRTGTTTLTEALNMINIPSLHYPSVEKYQKFYDKFLNRDFSDFSCFPAHYRGFTDIPFAYAFREFYINFPDSKFILTIRNDKEQWLESCKKNMSATSGPYIQDIRNKVYQSPTFSRKLYSIAYDNHLDKVFNFFADKTNQLLVYNVCEGDRWEPLCNFLNKPIPNRPFPFLNKSNNNE